ncbi:MAG: phage holin [Anaerovoracaceae bacterium]|nr:phage holin [Anaerovoracaceae bacterium]
MKNQRTNAIIRLVVMAVLMVNMVLTLAGKNPIPLDETALTEWLSVAAAGLSTLWSWWKNNNVTAAAREAQNTLKAIKEDGDGSDFAVDGELEGIEEEVE